jgi:hypothetical protein
MFLINNEQQQQQHPCKLANDEKENDCNRRVSTQEVKSKERVVKIFFAAVP